MIFGPLTFQRLARQRNLTMAQWATICTLSHLAGNTGRVGVNRTWLAEELGCSVRHMANIITDLEATGLMHRVWRYTGPHNYQLLVNSGGACSIARATLCCMPGCSSKGVAAAWRPVHRCGVLDD